MMMMMMMMVMTTPHDNTAPKILPKLWKNIEYRLVLSEFGMLTVKIAEEM
jgi:hypothetical protein